MGDTFPIHHLSSGETAVVAELLGAPDEVHRLEELGLRRGATVEMVQPGEPCIIRLEGGKLCFRDTEVYGVFVRSCVPS